ncbi:MAG: PDZ domain-containing protein [Gemmatimonadetes bacterium]|nr:PDZ domain-containing protein [Gemmatimonadota bacterium]
MSPSEIEGTVVAQRVEVVVRQATPDEASQGWLGFRSTVQVFVDDSGSRLTGSSLRVSEVFSDGPADRSGLRPGDLLVGFNGAALSVDRFQSVAQRLRPGDPVSLTVLRDGRRLDVTLTAEPRPSLEVMVPLQLQRALDASRSTFVARLDSVRPRIASAPRMADLELRRIRADSLHTVTVLSDGGPPRLEIRTPEGVFEWIGPGSPTASAPRAFSAWVYRTPTDSTGHRVTGGHVRTGAAPEPDPRAPSSPPAPPSVGRATVRPVPSPTPMGIRPLAPYLAGLNRVAGAELTTLSGELATYFLADHGLLVTDVAEGTPAADAGLVPGDVIVEAGGRAVVSIDALRAALSARAGPIQLGVVRRGLRVDVRLVN